MVTETMKLRHLLLVRKAITNLGTILKKRHYFANKVPSCQIYGFPVVMYGCESWTIKKAEHQRIDAFELWCGEDSCESFGMQLQPVHPEGKEISPEYSLEGLMQ